MDSSKFWVAPIKGYQYVSRMLPASCRYYPSCSEYAKWQFEFNAPHKALFHSTLRILRCNQLFAGGIDYPVVDFTPPSITHLLSPSSDASHIKIRYWLIPKDHGHCYVIKQFGSAPKAL
ncbi:MAG: membrane protein insertion efficiency factor YidD [Campylobacterales bacterium]|nr:membrane protein insertion efficiency factor YidD [Campylobacterales bacterium]